MKKNKSLEKNSQSENFISVKEFFNDGKQLLELTLISSSSGFENNITHSKIQKPGLALAGYVDFIHPGRVQILGKLEINYLKELSSKERLKVLSKIFQKKMCCIVLTSNLDPPDELLNLANESKVPVFKSSLATSQCIERITNFLSKKLAPKKKIHGVLLDIYGQGVLIIGESGIGKSECAVELIVRGHRLVSDDVIEIYRTSEGRIVGSAPPLSRYHLEVRGLGIINIKELFGISSITLEKEIDLIIELKKWEPDVEFDRLGYESMRKYELLGVDLPLIVIPVGPGRNLAVLTEIAVRKHLLDRKVYPASKEITKELENLLKSNQVMNDRDDE
ncbi:HPr(Ser) kinase/phosphatase [Candidatus Aminicenantes bacterium AC-335-B20]|jgi:HPr kinase/phosphorylase|nr:HPr(Ser) kinase/phosphatase [SCandidatus Aminicenantes bacterium Aminicenantia_JdfR_composite]MCP2596395.1 HPr(Ser) kinase/phosphatase [Candidatus Aminicenantes bacterium AC-335-G13]MCP2599262.1 HPr(Ser) kinase/phosphatase [Candidatus Aminicenantes bacterium AC-335-B20]MCP2618227.1 HPr(Ser) kinase/phosphatase [Candidatus Aminicenantes bacterium AC-335-A11]MCP2619487.1 HPr(Ser) kinase/phosphatase [Candidatus Aminicenantes bacterium AC-335-K20]